MLKKHDTTIIICSYIGVGSYLSLGGALPRAERLSARRTSYAQTYDHMHDCTVATGGVAHALELICLRKVA